MNFGSLDMECLHGVFNSHTPSLQMEKNEIILIYPQKMKENKPKYPFRKKERNSAGTRLSLWFYITLHVTF